MRSLVLELDALPILRQAMSAVDVDLAAAATLAELAGVDAVRLGVTPDLKPVREEDLQDLRRAARKLELRMPPSESLVAIALATRPDRVLMASDAREGRAAGAPLDLRSGAPGLAAVTRLLTDAGIAVSALVQPALEAVKRIHGEGIGAVELYTGGLVDLPGSERAGALMELSDAARLASKLKLGLGLAGGISYHSAPAVLAAAPACDRVAVGRAALSRAMLVGLDQALRDLRALLA